MESVLQITLIITCIIIFFPVFGPALGTFIIVGIFVGLFYIFFQYWKIWVGIIIFLIVCRIFEEKENTVRENNLRRNYQLDNNNISNQYANIQREHARAAEDIKRQQKQAEEELKKQQMEAEEELKRHYEAAAEDIRRQREKAEEELRRQQENDKIKNAIKISFETLDLSPNSSFADVKNKYHSLCMILHPDRYNNTKNEKVAAGQMKRINSAYEILKKYHFKVK